MVSIVVESFHQRFPAAIVRLGEHRSCKLAVEGSNPTRCKDFMNIYSCWLFLLSRYLISVKFENMLFSDLLVYDLFN